MLIFGQNYSEIHICMKKKYIHWLDFANGNIIVYDRTIPQYSFQCSKPVDIISSGFAPVYVAVWNNWLLEPDIYLRDIFYNSHPMVA